VGITASTRSSAHPTRSPVHSTRPPVHPSTRPPVDTAPRRPQNSLSTDELTRLPVHPPMYTRLAANTFPSLPMSFRIPPLLPTPCHATPAYGAMSRANTAYDAMSPCGLVSSAPSLSSQCVSLISADVCLYDGSWTGREQQR
jgi:hypothetical protein